MAGSYSKLCSLFMRTTVNSWDKPLTLLKDFIINQKVTVHKKAHKTRQECKCQLITLNSLYLVNRWSNLVLTNLWNTEQITSEMADSIKQLLAAFKSHDRTISWSFWLPSHFSSSMSDFKCNMTTAAVTSNTAWKSSLYFLRSYNS